MADASIHFYTIRETCSLISVVTYENARIEIPDSSFEWDSFIAAVDLGTPYESGGIHIGVESVTFRVESVLTHEQKLGLSVSIPKKRCEEALKRLRDIIEEFSASDCVDYVAAHSRGIFE